MPLEPATLRIADQDDNTAAILNVSNRDESLVRFMDGGSQLGVEGTDIRFAGQRFADGSALAGEELALNPADAVPQAVFAKQAEDMSLLGIHDMPSAYLAEPAQY